MNGRDYWIEAVESSLEEAGIIAIPQQITNIAGDMEVAHEQYGMAFGHDVASSNLQSAKDAEIADLRRQLCAEKEKITCTECVGKGSITIPGPYHSGTSTCYKCKGNGRL
jgi:DnaJ-class molecular chaperone